MDSNPGSNLLPYWWARDSILCLAYFIWAVVIRIPIIVTKHSTALQNLKTVSFLSLAIFNELRGIHHTGHKSNTEHNRIPLIHRIIFSTYSFLFSLFIYLVVPGLSWGMWNLVFWPGTNSWPLHRELQVSKLPGHQRGPCIFNCIKYLQEAILYAEEFWLLLVPYQKRSEADSEIRVGKIESPRWLWSTLESRGQSWSP